MPCASIVALHYVDAYPGFTGFVIDFANIETKDFFAYFHIDIIKSKKFTISKFDYNQPLVYFHVYSANKKYAEINKNVLVGALSWVELREMLRDKTVGRIKRNLEIVKIICDNNGSILPTAKMKNELNKQIDFNGLRL